MSGPRDAAVREEGDNLALVAALLVPPINSSLSPRTADQKDADRHDHFKPCDNNVHTSTSDFVIGHNLHKDWQRFTGWHLSNPPILNPTKLGKNPEAVNHLNSKLISALPIGHAA